MQRYRLRAITAVPRAFLATGRGVDPLPSPGPSTSIARKLTPKELALEAVIGRALLADRHRNIGDEQLGVSGVRFSAPLSLAEPDWTRVEVRIRRRPAAVR